MVELAKLSAEEIPTYNPQGQKTFAHQVDDNLAVLLREIHALQKSFSKEVGGHGHSK